MSEPGPTEGTLKPMDMREVPADWVEFTPAFIEEVQLGLHAGWSYKAYGPDESLVCWPEGAARPAGAWSVKRDRVLGEPVPLVERTAH